MVKLNVQIEYGGIKARFEGEYNEVWKSINEFLSKIARTGDMSIGTLSTSKKTVKEILLEMRNDGYFEEARTSADAYQRIKELGRTEMTQNAVAMVLRDLVSNKDLLRKAKGNGYVYQSPFAGQ